MYVLDSKAACCNQADVVPDTCKNSDMTQLQSYAEDSRSEYCSHAKHPAWGMHHYHM